MNSVKDEPKLHQQNSHVYQIKDLGKFQKLIKEYMDADEEAGREAITAKELCKHVTGESYEMFRKILNTQKITSKRDYIILIGIILRMDSNTISDLLSYYGMAMLNYDDDRDLEFVDVANCASTDENPDRRLSTKEINEKLEKDGFPVLELKRSRKQEESAFEFDIIEFKSYTTGDYQIGDRYDSIATQYDFDRYHFWSKMYVVDKKSGQKYILSADDRGYLCSELFPWRNKVESTFQFYPTVKDTGKFEKCFWEMKKSIRSEKRKIEGILNDTRNYGERIGAGVQNGKFHIFIESYNYDIPERDEYYLLEFINGKYYLFVFNESVFMKMYMPEKEYAMHYKMKENEPAEVYETEEEISSKIADNKRNLEMETLYHSRLRYYRELKRKVADCYEQICTGKTYVRNLKNIYDEPDSVCMFFGVQEEFDCQENEMGIRFVNKDHYEFQCAYGKVMITLQDLYNAFEIGFNSINEICDVKYKTGDVMSVLGGVGLS